MASAKMYKCDQCTFSTKYDYNLKPHVKVVHEKIKDAVACDKCDYKTHIQIYLQKHVKAVHDKIQDHVFGNQARKTRQARLDFLSSSIYIRTLKGNQTF